MDAFQLYNIAQKIPSGACNLKSRSLAANPTHTKPMTLRPNFSSHETLSTEDQLHKNPEHIFFL
jgi:hypothetical protein